MTSLNYQCDHSTAGSGPCRWGTFPMARCRAVKWDRGSVVVTSTTQCAARRAAGLAEALPTVPTSARRREESSPHQAKAEPSPERARPADAATSPSEPASMPRAQGRQQTPRTRPGATAIVCRFSLAAPA